MNLSETEIWSLCKLGYQLYVRERYEDAQTIFEGLVALDDSLGYPWHALGLIARERGDLARAADCFRQRLEIEPDAGESRVVLAEIMYESGHAREARDLLNHFAHRPDDDSEAARRGRVLLDRWT